MGQNQESVLGIFARTVYQRKAMHARSSPGDRRRKEKERSEYGKNIQCAGSAGAGPWSKTSEIKL